MFQSPLRCLRCHQRQLSTMHHILRFKEATACHAVLPVTGALDEGFHRSWGYNSWMVYFMEHIMKMDDNWGYPYSETSRSSNQWNIFCQWLLDIFKKARKSCLTERLESFLQLGHVHSLRRGVDAASRCTSLECFWRENMRKTIGL